MNTPELGTLRSQIAEQRIQIAEINRKLDRAQEQIARLKISAHRHYRVQITGSATCDIISQNGTVLEEDAAFVNPNDVVPDYQVQTDAYGWAIRMDDTGDLELQTANDTTECPASGHYALTVNDGVLDCVEIDECA